MPRPRVAMRNIREVLKLTFGEGLSRRQVSASSGVPLTTVSDYAGRAVLAGLGWPLPEGLDDEGLERPRCGGIAPSTGKHAGKCACCVREAWLADKPAAVKFIVRQLAHREPEPTTAVITHGPCCGPRRDADREAGG